MSARFSAPAADSSPAPLDPLALAAELMAVDSTTGREGEVVALVDRLLCARGWRTRRIPVSDGRDDLFAHWNDAPVVTLSTHLDTVPPFIPPRVNGGRLWGRGASDAKGVAAAMICAAERLRAAGVPVALLFVVGEETTHDGALAANESADVPRTSRVLINGEPTESMLAVGTKGALRLRVTTTGRAAHSAYPHLGESALAKLVQVLAELDALDLPSDPVLGATTINIGSIAGGVADNIVAPRAEARLMARTVTSDEELVAVLRRWLGTRATLELGSTVPPVHLATVPGFPTSVVAYATDLPNLSNWGTPLLFGPGSILVAHGEGEYMDIAELRAGVDAYERLAMLALERV